MAKQEPQKQSTGKVPAAPIQKIEKLGRTISKPPSSNKNVKGK
jgi:hypothetical protein